jgi:hypothetical protein
MERDQRNVNYESFDTHEAAISAAYGQIIDLAQIGQLPETLLTKLKISLRPSQKTIDNLLQIPSLSSPLVQTEHNAQTINILKETIIPYEIENNAIT